MSKDLEDAVRYANMMFEGDAIRIDNRYRSRYRRLMKGVIDMLDMSETIEAGDMVKLRNDLTIGELIEKRWGGCMPSIMVLLKSNASFKVEKVIDEPMVSSRELISGGELTIPKEFLRVVKKKPKPLYFDARKYDIAGIKPLQKLMEEDPDIFSDFLECHGLTKEAALEKGDWVGELFATEKPAPLEIIDGEVR